MHILLIPCRCLKLDFVRDCMGNCSEFSLTIDFYGYGYTSYENLTRFALILDQLRAAFFDPSIFCDRFTVYFIINYVFPPCDLTTGAPIPLCTDTCYAFRTICQLDYFSSILFARTHNYPIMDNCENTLIHLQVGYDFPCSSSSLHNKCINLRGMYVYISVMAKYNTYYIYYTILLSYIL